ncbi:beta-L-arabinofuranosidase domain-containing protein [Granulicella sibirica]|uniref:Putative glycosyl hydrolase (DUF1680) n=1 Tax=Granulicella sibirica TaxID=2479048 RepID=A0A4Q0T520_9BACT|nr:beta-L-arabinofuranosidase domain-containing protein [Granulicella sibirica]RXH57700.1 putative glycosyl hydrolase (DUF1680) [Granulicella sibirica]
MNRRSFLGTLAAIPLTPSLAFADKHPPASTATPESDRFHLTLNRVLHGSNPAYTPDFLLEDIHATPGRRFTEFSGDVSGRWVGALASASSEYGTPFPILDEVVHRVIAAQHPDGYFGSAFHYDQPTDRDLALLWGNGRLLVGLMEYHSLTKDPATLASARKLGDFLVRIGPEFNSKKMADDFGAAHFASSYICWTQQTEGLAALYAVTHDDRYKDLCAAISERIERRPSDHVHGYLCSLRGTVDLYQATHDSTHLRRAEDGWLSVMNSGDVLVTGGVPEAWSPKRLRTEGCAECDWLRLNLSLWRATANPKYLDTAEHILFNEFSMNQFSTGDFGHATLDESGIPQIVSVRAWWCCTLHGLRAFPDVHRTAFRSTGQSLFYDLPVDSTFTQAGLHVEAKSSLAQDGTIQLKVKQSPAGQRLTVRQPAWAETIHLDRNGHPVPGLTVSNLTPNDTITITYAMEKKQTPSPGNKGQLFTYGPWLLGAPSAVNPGYFNELHPRNTLLPATLQTASEPAQNLFAVPVAAAQSAYIPAEFPEQPSQVQLRAVAEQTSMLPTPWQIAFQVKKTS